MANIYPQDINEEYLANAHSGEAKTLLLLKNALSNEYTVFHSVHWAFNTSRYNDIGEIDFVVINAAGDVLLIEQKNGALDEHNGALVKSYGDRHKDVAIQIMRSQDRVLEIFRNHAAVNKKPNIEYLIYCPDYTIKDVAGLVIDKNRITDANTPGGICKKIESLLGKNKEKNPEWLKQVKDILRNSFKLTPDIHAFKTAQDENYIALTSGLVEFVANLEMYPFRLKVKGTAGCGKSTLASRFFENALAEKKKPLLLCFNRMLANSYKNALSNGGVANTWYGFIVDYLKAVGKPEPDFSQSTKDPKFWPELVSSVMDTDVPDNWLFDTIIVDEGQDFTQEWRDILEFFIKDQTDILWLEDEGQNLRDTEIDVTADFTIYHAKQNYRSPQLIADFIQKTLDINFENRNYLPGLPVNIATYKGEQEQNKQLEEAVLTLKKQGFKAQDIVILTCGGLTKSSVYPLESMAKEKLIKFTGNYTPQKEQLYTEGTLVFDSIHRFKGQQAPAIIVVDINPNPEKADYNKKVLYTCMTRATVSLTLLVKKDNPYNQRFIKYNVNS